jgi:hypothetical protein
LRGPQDPDTLPLAYLFFEDALFFVLKLKSPELPRAFSSPVLVLPRAPGALVADVAVP